jgi:hypothetical protein
MSGLKEIAGVNEPSQNVSDLKTALTGAAIPVRFGLRTVAGGERESRCRNAADHRQVIDRRQTRGQPDVLGALRFNQNKAK